MRFRHVPPPPVATAPFEPPGRMDDLGVVAVTPQPCVLEAPGAPEAIEAGCRCPKHANRFGYGSKAAHWGNPPYESKPGDPRNLFLVDRACKLHGALREAV